MCSGPETSIPTKGRVDFGLSDGGKLDLGLLCKNVNVLDEGLQIQYPPALATPPVHPRDLERISYSRKYTSPWRWQHPWFL